jgi:hypothetical protein
MPIGPLAMADRRPIDSGFIEPSADESRPIIRRKDHIFIALRMIMLAMVLLLLCCGGCGWVSIMVDVSMVEFGTDGCKKMYGWDFARLRMWWLHVISHHKGQ